MRLMGLIVRFTLKTSVWKKEEEEEEEEYMLGEKSFRLV
jgi:hypothetical protein